MKLDSGTPIERYVVQDVLGQGGMATVYRVKHAILGTQHALKVLHKASSTIAERLIHEGKLQAKLDPRVVVPVTEILDELQDARAALGLAPDWVPSAEAALQNAHETR